MSYPEMPLWSLTVRTVTWQDEGVGQEAALECCPKIACLLVLRPVSLRPMWCVGLCHLPNFKNGREREREKKKKKPNLAQMIIFHSCLPWQFILI